MSEKEEPKKEQKEEKVETKAEEPVKKAPKSSPFISDKDVFDVTVYYTEKDKETVILPTSEDGCESITVTFRYPDFQTRQQIIQASTQINESGVPSLNFLQLQNAMLYTLAMSWDVKDSKGEPVPLTHIGNLKVVIAAAILNGLSGKLGTESFLI